MARKPGSREYPGDNALCVQMAHWLLEGRGDLEAAAAQFEPKAARRYETTTAKSVRRRLRDYYRAYEDHWVAQASAERQTRQERRAERLAEDAACRRLGISPAIVREWRRQEAHVRWLNEEQRRVDALNRLLNHLRGRY
jgi:hypothetical protein